MHRSTQRFLRFTIDGAVWAFTALPFGLGLSPWVLTHLMDVIVASVRRETPSYISNYLDDLLQKSQDPQQLCVDPLFLLERLAQLGFIVNRAKSELERSQDFVHLGMHFLTESTPFACRASIATSSWRQSRPCSAGLRHRRELWPMSSACVQPQLIFFPSAEPQYDHFSGP